MTNSKQLVYSVMHDLLPGIKLDDSTKLDDIGYDDSQSKDVIRGAINKRHWQGVQLGFGALSDCSVIKDITKVVEEA